MSDMEKIVEAIVDYTSENIGSVLHGHRRPLAKHLAAALAEPEPFDPSKPFVMDFGGGLTKPARLLADDMLGKDPLAVAAIVDACGREQGKHEHVYLFSQSGIFTDPSIGSKATLVNIPPEEEEEEEEPEKVTRHINVRGGTGLTTVHETEAGALLSATQLALGGNDRDIIAEPIDLTVGYGLDKVKKKPRTRQG